MFIKTASILPWPKLTGMRWSGFQVLGGDLADLDQAVRKIRKFIAL